MAYRSSSKGCCISKSPSKFVVSQRRLQLSVLEKKFHFACLVFICVDNETYRFLLSTQMRLCEFASKWNCVPSPKMQNKTVNISCVHKMRLFRTYLLYAYYIYVKLAKSTVHVGEFAKCNLANSPSTWSETVRIHWVFVIKLSVFTENADWFSNSNISAFHIY